MATIPVEKKSGFPIWALLLGLLLLALLIWFIATRNDDDTAATDTTEDVVVLPAATSLDLNDVWVTRVVGDNTFFVSSDSAGTEETLVYIEEATPGTEGRHDVAPGQHIALTGAMMPVGDQDLTVWGLSTDQASMMTPASQYVRASALTVLSGAVMGDDAMMADGAMAADTAGMAAAMPAAPATTPSTGTITRTDDLYGTDLKPVIGRRVEIDDATVLTVNGDSTFYVGAAGKRFLVALSGLGESQSGPGDGSDGRFNIDVGQRISLRGTVTAFDAASPVFRGLSAADRTDATTRGAFVNVTRAADVTKK